MTQRIIRRKQLQYGTLKARRGFLDKTAKGLGITTLSDWYNVNLMEFKKKGGKSILKFYGRSICRVLSSVYPQLKWRPWLFKHSIVEDGFWKKPKNQHEFLQHVATEYNITTMDQWYAIDLDDIAKLGGNTLVKKYHQGSTSLLIQTIYTHYKWIPWKFRSVPQRFWHAVHNIKAFLRNAEQNLNVKTLSDWYRVSQFQIFDQGGSGLLKDWPRALKIAYPDQIEAIGAWRDRDPRNKRAVQALLATRARDLF